MKILGIDIGINGAIAFGIGGKNSFSIQEIKFFPTICLKRTRKDYIPADIFALIPEEIDYAIIEQPIAMPKQAIQTCASLFKCLGYVEMVMIAKKIPYQLVRPSTWKRDLIKDISGNDIKAKSIIACKRLFPDVDLRRTKESKKNDDNIAEAVLLAYYGWKKWKK